MRVNSLLGAVLTLAAGLLFLPVAHAGVEGCPEENCVESETTLVFNPQTNMMDAFTSATTDYATSYWYDLCVNLAVVRLNGPYLINETILLPSLTPSPCSAGAVELDMSGSVPTTPGRQYLAIGLAELHVYFEYGVIVPYPTCDEYCEGYWYDALGYSLISTSDPSNANWPSIMYTYYPFLPVPVPVIVEEIAMNGSIATAWSPPVIYSVTPNQWPAGTTTTFTISGDGFGYGPSLTISGNGITGYTNPCAASPSASCNTQIVATVTIDANTPGGSAEMITVTTGGLNLSGFLPVDTGQSGQATAQAVALALIAFRPYIVLGTGGGACVGADISGAARSVQVGQQITFTACLPAGTPLSNVSSMSWTPTTPPGTAVGGFTAINSGAGSSGAVVALSTPSCTVGQAYCNFPPFYWVDQGNNRQFTFRYTLTNGSSNEATVTFNVGGPTGVNVVPTPSPAGVTIVYPPANCGGVPIDVPIMIFGAPGVRGMNFYATATNLAGGSYRWVQLVQHDRVTILGSLGKTGPTDEITGQPAVDKAYPYGYNQQGNSKGTVTTTTVLNDTAQDSPAISLISTWGEEERWFQATMYLMWVPTADPNCYNGALCTIPVTQGKVEWSTAGDAINTRQPIVNQGVSSVQWVLNACSGGGTQPYQPSTVHPQWTTAINP